MYTGAGLLPIRADISGVVIAFLSVLAAVVFIRPIWETSTDQGLKAVVGRA